MKTLLNLTILSLAILSLAELHAADDIVIDAFDNKRGYRNWKTTGEAFGRVPAKGTLPGQMLVSNYTGRFLANSFHNGDGSMGTLTSRPLQIQRGYISFLIGGSKDAAKSCMNLLLGNKIVRTATGPNEKPDEGGTLVQGYWDVSEFIGKTLVIQIVDQATNGHITVDQIVQTDRQPRTAVIASATRELTLEKRYLNLPVENGASQRWVSVLVDGQPVRSFGIPLADAKPDWWAFTDVSDFKGKKCIIEIKRLPEDFAGFRAIYQSDEIHDSDIVYREKLRPQFHFTARRGMLNDPHLVFYDGEYHMFFQYNPYLLAPGFSGTSWGHAVSQDLVHWKELPIAIYPDQGGRGLRFSGSAVVDWNNTAGFQTDDEKTLVSIHTTARATSNVQDLAYSNDRGRTWTLYANNPVLSQSGHGNRDPKVIWHEPEKKWVMALSLGSNEYGLFCSQDLKRWTQMSSVKIPGTDDCPELFEIAVDDNEQNTRWIIYGGSGAYLVGTFDGKTFVPESGPHAMHFGNCFYGSQTFNDIPTEDGRRILIPWCVNPWEFAAESGMPFAQMQGIPVSLTLRSTEDGLRLFANPVKELELLRTKGHSLKAQELDPGENPLKDIRGELLDISAEITPAEAQEVTFILRGVPVTYDVKQQRLTCQGKTAPLKLADSRIRLRMLVDRTSIDIFGNDGRLYMPIFAVFPTEKLSVEVYAKGGSATINALEVQELKSAWRTEKGP